MLIKTFKCRLTMFLITIIDYSLFDGEGQGEGEVRTKKKESLLIEERRKY